MADPVRQWGPGARPARMESAVMPHKKHKHCPCHKSLRGSRTTCASVRALYIILSLINLLF